jgi:undecaprenyl-diphosphatase
VTDIDPGVPLEAGAIEPPGRELVAVTPSSAVAHPAGLGELRRRVPWLLPVAVVTAVALSVLAAIGEGKWLVWDEPITRQFVDWRSAGVDRVALWVSRLGSTPVVLLGGLVGVLLAARRSRAVALVMLVVVATRGPLEWLLKEAVTRPRPAGDRLVEGSGYSFPSGHVLAAAATWGFVPVIAGLYFERRRIVRALTGVTVTVIVLVAWCRVWLGVHWTSDVVGSLAFAFVGAVLVGAVLDLVRHRRADRVPSVPESRPSTPGSGDETDDTQIAGVRTAS